MHRLVITAKAETQAKEDHREAASNARTETLHPAWRRVTLTAARDFAAIPAEAKMQRNLNETGNVQLFVTRIAKTLLAVRGPLCWIRGKVKGIAALSFVSDGVQLPWKASAI